MRPHTPAPLLTAALIAALLVAPIAGAAAQPMPFATPEDSQQADPAERVGRVARITGGLSFRATEAGEWTRAAPNYPVAPGMGFGTDPGSSAWLDLARGRIALAGATVFHIDALGEQGLRASLSGGEAYVILSTESWSLRTALGQANLVGPGRFAITAGDADTPASVSVLEGLAEIVTAEQTIRLGPGQAATWNGSGVTVAAARPSAFVTVMRVADRPPVAAAVPLPPVVAEMPGGAELSDHGDWAVSGDYGTVWYPRVGPEWVPYRAGNWAWVAPWGWTWIDDAPWGFAPSHYGRWTEIGRRWAWVPHMAHAPHRPVYAPAVIGFLGAGAAVGMASRPVGWYPLAPREAYRPWYRASARYTHAMNVPYLSPGPQVIHPRGGTPFHNRAAATMAPASAMAASAPLRHIARPADARVFGGFHTTNTAPPVQPTAATAGITPHMAQRMNLPAPGTHPGGMTPGGAYPGGAYPGGAYHGGPAGRVPEAGGRGFAPPPGAAPMPLVQSPRTYPGARPNPDARPITGPETRPMDRPSRQDFTPPPGSPFVPGSGSAYRPAPGQDGGGDRPPPGSGASPAYRPPPNGGFQPTPGSAYQPRHGAPGPASPQMVAPPPSSPPPGRPSASGFAPSAYAPRHHAPTPAPRPVYAPPPNHAPPAAPRPQSGGREQHRHPNGR